MVEPLLKTQRLGAPADNNYGVVRGGRVFLWVVRVLKLITMRVWLGVNSEWLGMIRGEWVVVRG